MTLIVGIKCEDGIVMGADAAATMGSLGQRTIMQPVNKLQIIEKNGRKAVLGVSGPVGLGQKFKSVLEGHFDLSPNSLSGAPLHTAARTLQQIFWEPVEQEMTIAATAKNCIGNQLALESAISSSLLAIEVSGDLCLFVCNQQCSFEEITELTFEAIGSGVASAHMFLSFLKRVFFEDQLPSVSEGVFYTVWTLDHAIRTAPGGIAGPIQIVTIQKRDGDLTIQELAQEDIDEHLENYAAAEQRLREYKLELAGAEAVVTPDAAAFPEPPVSK